MVKRLIPAKSSEKSDQKPSSATDEKSGGFRQWLTDSYNGIFKILIQPQLPSLRLMGLLLVAFLFGLIWAYGIASTRFYNAAPYQLSESARNQWIINVAGLYQANIFEDSDIIWRLKQIEKPGDAVQSLINAEQARIASSSDQRPTRYLTALQAIQPLATQANDDSRAAPKSGGFIGEIFSLILAIIVFLIVVNLFAILWGFFLGGYARQIWERIRPKSEEEKQRDTAAHKVQEDIVRRKKIQAEMEREVATAGASDLGAPLITKPSIYTKGRAYDDSFAIEDANDMFLGECGATIAKTIGDSQELAAVEIWLFDKDDFVRTLTKLFVSEHAYNDPVIRSELEPKVDNPATDLVPLRPGATVILDSKKIHMQAKVVDMGLGRSPDLPPNSHFESFTLQMQAWEKTGVEVASAVPIPAKGAASALDSYQVGPPPAMPAGMSSMAPTQPTALPIAKPPVSSSGQRPLDSYQIGPPPPMPTGMQTPKATPTPAGGGVRPPMSPSRGQISPKPAATQKDEEDPFGGTGDFTPIPK